jgi:hypothetical protein
MKSLPFASITIPALALALGACQPTLVAHTDAGSPGTTGAAGATTGAAGNPPSSGGAGAEATAGAQGAAGSTAGASGDTGGAAAGAPGDAGASGAMGGAGAGGGAGSGTDGGAGATAGAGGGGGAAAGASGETVTDLFGTKNQYNDVLADSFFLWPCYSNQNQDCISIPSGQSCPKPDPNGNFEEQGLVVNESFKVGGTPGKMYMATIQVNGISEAKYYQGGVRAAGDTDPPNAQSDKGTNTWYTGGSAIYFEYYNVYSIRVYDTAMKELQHYYLNSFPKTGNVQYEDHWTFAISYQASFPVMGGGTIVYHSSDINCHAIDNCGNATTSQTCPLSQARMVPNEPGLKVPTTYMGKQTSGMNYRTGATQPWHSHIIHVKFIDVKPM